MNGRKHMQPIVVMKKMLGLSLVELLIALVINIFLIGALVAVFSSNLGGFNQRSDSDLLNERLVSAMSVMTSSIRRAGYWANAYTDLGLNQNNNPFMTDETDIQTGSGGSCILFTYDANGDGELPSISAAYDDERYGYRLSGGAVQARPRGASFSCSAGSGEWENLIDPSVVTITSLQFTIDTKKLDFGEGAVSSNTGLEVRSVDITLTGRLTNDTSVTQTLTQRVRVRNDKFIP